MIFVDSAEPQKIAEMADIAEMAEIPNAGFYMYPSDKSVIDGIDYMSRCDMQVKEDIDHVIKGIMHDMHDRYGGRYDS